MTLNRKDITKILEEIGTLLELRGENPFKIRAYFNAARTIETMQQDVLELIKNGKISEVKGIGKAISEKLGELVEKGYSPYHQDLKESLPPGLPEMLNIPGMGPQKIRAVYDKLGITTIGQLEYACLENRLRDLKGFGQKSQNKILQGIELRKKYQGRFHYHIAGREADKIMQYLQKHDKIIRMELAGSMRRKKEIVKDIDILATCKETNRDTVMEYFVSGESVESVTGKGQTKSSVVLDSGINCDLRLVEDAQFPFALHHFTGSKEHNTAMRQFAKSKGLTMNEYGLFREKSEKTIDCATEQEVFSALKLAYIEPELRENMGEIEKAQKNALPELVQESDIKGIFHVHSSYSDGTSTVKELARACQDRGLQYLGICDHSKSAFYANGLSEERIKEQQEDIDRVNEQLKGFTVFKGIECDILADGTLDYEDKVLQSFDFVIVSVHSSFNLDEDQMTKRICAALKNPLVTMLGHPTGRLLLGREAYAVDMHMVIETAAKYNKIIEINGNPHRLDLDWRWGKYVNEMDLHTAVNPDAHSVEGLDDFRYGVAIARKGWFPKERVINTLTTEQLKKKFSA
ncbi:MAG: DNA polymerase/3'-5' exonuclease PolX [Caldithrix sp.]|nr:DNA polymerase/3'-5' exonuclease PolX [Caldithrix sp.]